MRSLSMAVESLQFHFPNPNGLERKMVDGAVLATYSGVLEMLETRPWCVGDQVQPFTDSPAFIEVRGDNSKVNVIIRSGGADNGVRADLGILPSRNSWENMHEKLIKGRQSREAVFEDLGTGLWFFALVTVAKN